MGDEDGVSCVQRGGRWMEDCVWGALGKAAWVFRLHNLIVGEL